MARPQKQKLDPEAKLASAPSSPLVFISHDARDAALAEAFSKLLKSVSAGMIKTFRSSDKQGNEGIDFGEEWYNRLMDALQSTSDVVCLFTERSLERPWILFEAGVAKGKLSAPVVGVALGVPLNRISAGPFYQFMNMDDSEADLTKLVQQLARRIPGLELDVDVVKVQVAAFKTTEAAILSNLTTSGGKKESKVESDDSAIAKLVEEMKSLPSRVAERLMEAGDPIRRRKVRRFHPAMFADIMHVSGYPGDPIGLLMAASVLREDVPWLYELAMEVYRTVKSGDAEAIKLELNRLERFSEVMLREPFIDSEIGGREAHMFFMEFPRMLQHMLTRTLEQKVRRRHTSQPKPKEP
jgi:TIR domain